MTRQSRFRSNSKLKEICEVKDRGIIANLIPIMKNRGHIDFCYMAPGISYYFALMVWKAALLVVVVNGFMVTGGGPSISHRRGNGGLTHVAG